MRGLLGDGLAGRKADPPRPPARVLHVVQDLDRGAVENWLVRMLAHANVMGIDLDWSFYCTSSEPGAMDERARSLGARVLYAPVSIKQKLELPALFVLNCGKVVTKFCIVTTTW